MQANDIRGKLSNIYWISGSPCSGKSTIADILSKKHHLSVYHVDQVFYERQVSLITPEQQPTLTKWHNTAWDELWIQPHEVLLTEAKACYDEHFDLIIQDLQRINQPTPMIVEGTALLPGRVNEVISDRSKATWLVPDETFQRHHYPLRGRWVQGILAECQDPELALENWMGRDAAFARWVIDQTRQLDLEVLVVDRSSSIEENTAMLERHFGLEEK